MFHICSTRRTVDSKIDENRCKQKYELIQVVGILYSQVYNINCLKLQFYIDRYTDVQRCKIIGLYHIVFFHTINLLGEQSFFYTLSHLY